LRNSSGSFATFAAIRRASVFGEQPRRSHQVLREAIIRSR
jgi:hypothetical protein